MAGDLTKYQKMRDFAKTPEPKGTKGRQTGYRYLIQKHAATRLHYDFRLELDGVLKSWAVTRGPSLDPHEKRLAVEVEDHPLDYGDFEGTIPKGQYGGGTVMLWDVGEWEPIGDSRKGLEKGKLEFRLKGKRLKGEWTLVRMRDRPKDNGKHNWLLIKRTDKEAREGDADALLKKHVTSAVSGRTMEKIAKGGEVWQSKPKAAAKEKKAMARAALKTKLTKISSKKLPAFIPPQLATLTDTLPKGTDWVHELKFDGYRALVYVEGGNVRILTRTGLDWTHKFSTLATELAKLPVTSAVLDGEIVALDEEGAPSFKTLQNTLSEEHDEGLQYYAFDLLYLNGKDVMDQPLIVRKKLLQPLLKGKRANMRVFYSEHFTLQDEDTLKKVCGSRFEGLISKRAQAPYRSGRGMSWLKTKCHMRQEFVIGGFTLPTHAERGIGALLLGYYEGKTLRYVGKVGTGFDTTTSLVLRKKLEGLLQKKESFASVPGVAKRGAVWVKPTLVCEVEFTEWTPDKRLRHPSFQGLREDKPAVAITRDKPVAAQKIQKSKVEETSKKVASPKKTPAVLKKGAGKVSIEGITVTHPERIIYPETTITKADLAAYYQAIAAYVLPHVAHRPLSMIRCPEGISEECFFQRHMAHAKLEHIYDTGIPVKGRQESYLMIKDIKGLITMVQWGVVELHPWGCLADRPEKPDRMIFDLDPDPELPWKKVVAGAEEVRLRMRELGLESFVKTTGGKGLHVVVPMTRHYGWPAIKAFARAIAEAMAHDAPDVYVAKANKMARKGKIFVDYLRNDLTSTAVAAFSVRAREGAPVAMPVSWEEVAKVKPAAHTMLTVPKYLAKRKQDPWEELFTMKQKISATHLKTLRIES